MEVNDFYNKNFTMLNDDTEKDKRRQKDFHAQGLEELVLWKWLSRHNNNNNNIRFSGILIKMLMTFFT